MAPSEILYWSSPFPFESARSAQVNPGENKISYDRYGHEVSVTCLDDDSATVVEHVEKADPNNPRHGGGLLGAILGRPPKIVYYQPPVSANLGDGSSFRCGEGPLLSLEVTHHTKKHQGEEETGIPNLLGPPSSSPQNE